MDLFVLKSWSKFANVPLSLMSRIITNTKVRDTLKQLLDSSNPSDYWLPLILTDIELPLSLMLIPGILIEKAIHFAGVEREVNSKVLKSFLMKTKKNTQISSLSVLSVVCYYHLAQNIQMIACCANLNNIFVSCYV